MSQDCSSRAFAPGHSIVSENRSLPATRDAAPATRSVACSSGAGRGGRGKGRGQPGRAYRAQVHGSHNRDAIMANVGMTNASAATIELPVVEQVIGALRDLNVGSVVVPSVTTPAIAAELNQEAVIPGSHDASHGPPRAIGSASCVAEAGPSAESHVQRFEVSCARSATNSTSHRSKPTKHQREAARAVRASASSPTKSTAACGGEEIKAGTDRNVQPEVVSARPLLSGNHHHMMAAERRCAEDFVYEDIIKFRSGTHPSQRAKVGLEVTDRITTFDVGGAAGSLNRYRKSRGKVHNLFPITLADDGARWGGIAPRVVERPVDAPGSHAYTAKDYPTRYTLCNHRLSECPCINVDGPRNFLMCHTSYYMTMADFGRFRDGDALWVINHPYRGNSGSIHGEYDWKRTGQVIELERRRACDLPCGMPPVTPERAFNAASQVRLAAELGQITMRPAEGMLGGSQYYHQDVTAYLERGFRVEGGAMVGGFYRKFEGSATEIYRFFFVPAKDPGVVGVGQPRSLDESALSTLPVWLGPVEIEVSMGGVSAPHRCCCSKIRSFWDRLVTGATNGVGAIPTHLASISKLAWCRSARVSASEPGPQVQVEEQAPTEASERGLAMMIKLAGMTASAWSSSMLLIAGALMRTLKLPGHQVTRTLDLASQQAVLIQIQVAEIANRREEEQELARLSWNGESWTKSEARRAGFVIFALLLMLPFFIVFCIDLGCSSGPVFLNPSHGKPSGLVGQCELRAFLAVIVYCVAVVLYTLTQLVYRALFLNDKLPLRFRTVMCLPFGGLIRPTRRALPVQV